MKKARRSRSHSTISLDSLENICVNMRQNKMKDNIESYVNKLVPLYDGDKALSLVLPWKPSRQKSNTSSNKSGSSIILSRNKSYLQQFREKMSIPLEGSISPQNVSDLPESICPEFGDTDLDSIGSETSFSSDFFNTECYNEKLYTSILENRKTSDINLDIVASATIASATEAKYIKSASENDLDTVKIRIIDSARKLKSCQKSNLTSPYLDGDKIKNRIKIQEYSKKIQLENKMKFIKKRLSQSTDAVVSKCKSEHKETVLKCLANNKQTNLLPQINSRRKQENKKEKRELLKSDNDTSDRATEKSLENIENTNSKINCHCLVPFSKKVPNNLRSLRERHSLYKEIVGKMKLKL